LLSSAADIYHNLKAFLSTLQHYKVSDRCSLMQQTNNGEAAADTHFLRIILVSLLSLTLANAIIVLALL
jgi:hypothetical protein